MHAVYAYAAYEVGKQKPYMRLEPHSRISEQPFISLLTRV